MATQHHICSVCSKEFPNEAGYLVHDCTTGYKPTQIEHQDALTSGRASKIADAAVKRADKRAKKKAKKAAQV